MRNSMKTVLLFFILLSYNPVSSQKLPDQIFCSSADEKAIELFANGKKALSGGLVDHAQKFFYYATKEDSLFCDANFYLGYTFRLQDDWRTAANYYIVAYKLNDTIPPFIQNLGHALLILGYYEKAREIFLRLTEVDAENPEGYYGVAMSEEALDLNESAMKNLQKSIQLFKSNNVKNGQEISYLKGIILAKTGKFELAIETLERIYKKFDKQEQMNFYLGTSYYYYNGANEKYTKNRVKKARKYLKKAKKLGTDIDVKILEDLSIN